MFEPLLWSWADRHRGVRLVCQPVGEIPLPFQTWILIYPGNYNQPATSCDGVAPAIYEFLFTVILLLAVNFEHLQRGITSTWSKLQVTPTGHALLALLLNFGMGTAIVFFNNNRGAIHCLALDQSTFQPASEAFKCLLTFWRVIELFKGFF